MKLEDTELPRRVCTDLRNAGITTVDELCQYTWMDLLAQHRIGRRSLDDIEQMLAGIGKKLKEGKPSRKLEDTKLHRGACIELRNIGITTVEELCQYTRMDLLGQHNIRRWSVEKVEMMLDEIGKKLKEDKPS